MTGHACRRLPRLLAAALLAGCAIPLDDTRQALEDRAVSAGRWSAGWITDADCDAQPGPGRTLPDPDKVAVSIANHPLLDARAYALFWDAYNRTYAVTRPEQCARRARDRAEEARRPPPTPRQQLDAWRQQDAEDERLRTRDREAEQERRIRDLEDALRRRRGG